MLLELTLRAAVFMSLVCGLGLVKVYIPVLKHSFE
jgi:hypothetical protein